MTSKYLEQWCLLHPFSRRGGVPCRACKGNAATHSSKQNDPLHHVPCLPITDAKSGAMIETRANSSPLEVVLGVGGTEPGLAFPDSSLTQPQPKLVGSGLSDASLAGSLSGCTTSAGDLTRGRAG